MIEAKSSVTTPAAVNTGGKDWELIWSTKSSTSLVQFQSTPDYTETKQQFSWPHAYHTSTSTWHQHRSCQNNHAGCQNTESATSQQLTRRGNWAGEGSSPSRFHHVEPNPVQDWHWEERSLESPENHQHACFEICLRFCAHSSASTVQGKHNCSEAEMEHQRRKLQNQSDE